MDERDEKKEYRREMIDISAGRDGRDDGSRERNIIEKEIGF